MIKVTSPAFQSKEEIPRRYTGEGEDVSPALFWSGAPDTTREFAIICDDPDAPREQPWVHWVLYHIPAGCRGLDEGDAGGAMAGQNDFGRNGYGGPLPPPGHGRHRYHFHVYALDTMVDLGPAATKERLIRAMKWHVLDEGELIGTYERK